MNRKIRKYFSCLAVPAILAVVGCSGTRHFKTVMINDPSYDENQSMDHSKSTGPTPGLTTTRTTSTKAEFSSASPTSGISSKGRQPEYATFWGEDDTASASLAEAIGEQEFNRSSFNGNDTGLSTRSAGARIWGDAPESGLDSDVTHSGRHSDSTMNPKGTKKDSRLGLFGEVDGIGGLPGQFAALESIEQISFAGEGADFDPSIDFTGENLLYASTQHGDTADIYVKSIEGKTVTRLTGDPADDIMPVYSPDNQHIAFSSNRSGNWDLYVMDAEGGRPVRLTDDTQHELHPSWSPDGKYIVYSRLSDSSGRWELWITEFANPVKRQFIGYGLFPSWSPDPAQNKIVYQQARERGSRLFSIWAIDFENGEGRRPTEIASAANAAAVNPSWSADGKMISFATIIDPDKQDPNHPQFADIWVVALDGTGLGNLTNGEFTNLEPCWGPDGRIYFISDRSGVDNVWAMRPDGIIKTARGGKRGTIGRRTEMAGVPTDTNQ